MGLAGVDVLRTRISGIYGVLNWEALGLGGVDVLRTTYFNGFLGF